MIANITVYTVAYLLFHVQAIDDNNTDSLGPQDIPVFRVRIILCCSVQLAAVGGMTLPIVQTQLDG